MVTSRQFISNLIGAGVIAFWQLVCLGIFAVGYLPQFPKLAVAQQLTVVVAAILSLAFTVGVVGMFVSSIVVERPGRRQPYTVIEGGTGVD